MPYKDPAKRAQASRERYQRIKDNPEYKERKARNSARRYKENKKDPNFLTWKQKILKEGKDKPCDSCGVYNDWRCNDFHHKNPADKSFTISNSAARVTKEEFNLEISKCYVLCCLCHRKIHSNLLEMLS